METVGGLQGFVELKTVNRTTGKVTQYCREYNTLTHGALASIFARGMFEKGSCYQSEMPMPNVHFGDRSNSSWNPENYSELYYRYLNNNGWTYCGNEYYKRDSRGMNNGLAGISPVDDKYALYSAFAPNTYGVYLMENEIQRFDKYTQVPPYASNKSSALSPDVMAYSQGVYMDETNSTELTQQMYGSSEGSFFNPAHLIHARQLVRHAGSFYARSVSWGADVNDACCWGVRARIKGFDLAGYSHFYAIQHKLVDNSPQTILWQDDRVAGWYTNTNVTRDLCAYNITTGKIDQTIRLTSKPSNWMGVFMQGVVIGDSVFAVSQSGTTITIKRYDNWKSGTNTVSATKTISLTATTTGTSVSSNAVAVHNLVTDRLEIFTTLVRRSDEYEVQRISVNPSTLDHTVSSHFLPYLITQSLPSVSGTQAGVNSTNSGGQTRASTFIGFLDYTSKTDTTDGVYHLPFSAFISNGAEIAVGGFTSSWMYGYRTGVRFTINNNDNKVTLGSEFIVCGIYSFTAHSMGIDDNLAWYAADANYRTCNHDKVLQWGYTKTVFDNTVLPVQMLPVAGPYYNSDPKDRYYAIGKNPFSLMSVSRVLCGLNLKTMIYKGEDDSLYVTYGWQLKISN
jgi:hypothetical protein